MKKLVWTKEVIGAGGIVQPIGQQFEVEDDKLAQSYIDKGIAELAPSESAQDEGEAAAKAEAEAAAKAEAEAAAKAEAEAAAKAEAEAAAKSGKKA